MAPSEPLTDLEQRILRDGSREWFQFFQLLGEVEDATGLGGTDAEVRTLDLVNRLMTKGLVDVGSVIRGTGFVSWNLSPEETIRKIEDKLRALTEPPSLGDVCWMANTAKGNRLVRDLDPSGGHDTD